MHGHVHFGEPGIGVGLFLSEERNLRSRIFAFFLDEMPGLHKHTRRAASRIEYDAVIGFNDGHNGIDQGRRREKLATFLRPVFGKFVEEVFIDPPEHIARHTVEFFGVEDTDQALEQVFFKLLISFGSTPERAS